MRLGSLGMRLGKSGNEAGKSGMRLGKCYTNSLLPGHLNCLQFLVSVPSSHHTAQEQGYGVLEAQPYNSAAYLRDICRHVSDWRSRNYDQVIRIGHSFMGASNFPVTMETTNQINAFTENGLKQTYAIKIVLRAANSDWCIPGKTAATQRKAAL